MHAPSTAAHLLFAGDASRPCSKARVLAITTRTTTLLSRSNHCPQFSPGVTIAPNGMSNPEQLRQPKSLSRGIDYLGDLGAKLRDLQGDRTLAYELIQNADDPTATSMCFDVTNEALIVDNDGTFSDCGVV